MRSLNARGLDMRLRVPDWIEGLEAALRPRIAGSLKRGSLSLTLRISRDEAAGAADVDKDVLARVLSALDVIGAEAARQGLALGPASLSDIAAMNGVLEKSAPDTDNAALRAALLADFDMVLKDFLKTRQNEGAALKEILVSHVSTVERLTADAAERLPLRAEKAATSLREALARVVSNTDGVDEARVAQELAILAVKSDITEELDRLSAHVTAARELLDSDGPVGRKLDFLTQEFNREANTLCSKSQDVALTRIGLDLKAVVDQMREQVQNVE